MSILCNQKFQITAKELIQKHTQFGLKSMTRHATEMSIQINIRNGAGTTIIMTLPFG
jgi:hypothetical protein